METKSKTSNLKLKNAEDDNGKNGAQVIEGALNALKTKAENEGLKPKTTSVIIRDFAGKTLKRSKSVMHNKQQFFVKAGTKWEDVDVFARRNIVFSDADFK